MKITYKKGQAATEFLMTYGWAILAIVIVAAVLWNMGIFKSSCTATAPVQVFPAGSQLAVADWALTTNNALNMTVNNLAGNSITISAGSANFSSGSGVLAAPVSIAAGGKEIVEIDASGTGTAGTCFTGGSVTLTYAVSGGVPHSITGTMQGKY